MNRFVFEERPYQTEAVAQVLAEFENGRESVLLESPVGSGKTVMGLMIIQKLQENSVTILHTSTNSITPNDLQRYFATLPI